MIFKNIYEIIILFIQLPIKVSLAFHPDVPINSGVVTHMVRLAIGKMTQLVIAKSGVVTHMVRLAILLYHPRNSLCLALEVKWKVQWSNGR